MEYEMRNPRDMSFEYMMPSSSWTQNTDSYCLLLHLPGFKTEEVRIGADKHGHLTVSGERQTDGDKVIHFEQSFMVPENCDIGESSGIIEDGILYVTIPKNETQSEIMKHDEIQNNINNDKNTQEKDGTSQEEEEEEEEESSRRANSADGLHKESVVEKISKNLKKNRGVVFTAFLAFSLGVVVSNRFQSTKKDKRSK